MNNFFYRGRKWCSRSAACNKKTRITNCRSGNPWVSRSYLPSVGIIQIRLWVEVFLPLSRLLPAPRMFFYCSSIVSRFQILSIIFRTDGTVTMSLYNNFKFLFQIIQHVVSNHSFHLHSPHYYPRCNFLLFCKLEHASFYYNIFMVNIPYSQ